MSRRTQMSPGKKSKIGADNSISTFLVLLERSGFSEHAHIFYFHADPKLTELLTSKDRVSEFCIVNVRHRHPGNSVVMLIFFNKASKNVLRTLRHLDFGGP